MTYFLGTILLGLLGCTLFALLSIRFWDEREDRKEWQKLEAIQPSSPPLYGTQMVSGLPEPVQRYFNFAIRPGTPLWTVADINMGGNFSLGDKSNPLYHSMQARQILAAPAGFLWKMKLESGMPVSGSDSARWTRFRIFGLLPVARMGSSADHTRSAFGRFIAEALFWTPAALLPRPGISWEQLDENGARVTVLPTAVRHNALMCTFPPMAAH